MKLEFGSVEDLALFVLPCVDLCVSGKIKYAKCSVEKNKTSLRWLVGLEVNPCRMFFQKFGFMSVSLMVARSLSSIAGNCNKAIVCFFLHKHASIVPF